MLGSSPTAKARENQCAVNSFTQELSQFQIDFKRDQAHSKGASMEYMYLNSVGWL